TGNGEGVSLGGDWASRLVNNYMDNVDNGFFGVVEQGMLNITKTPGRNIVGGPFLGGNYWAHPNGTGFSQTHPDADGDGICDEPYVLNPEEGVIDHLPLAMPGTTPGPIGGDTGYFLVSTVPAGAEISLVDISGTRYPQGNTSAGPLNVTVYLTGTPIRQIVATLPGYRDAVHNVTRYPSKGETLPVTLVLERAMSGPTPYRPHALPGRIEAEDYDVGGEGAAYHDTTPGNAGGAYRQDDVDIERLTGVATPNVGWIRDGEWLSYTATVEAAGQYTMTARVASPNSGRSIALHVDGRSAATIAVPRTGSFTTWRTVAVPVTLSAGTHTLRLTFAGDGQNLDWIAFATAGGVTTTPTTPVPAGGASFSASPTTAPKGSAVKFTLTPAGGKTVKSAWWSFDATAHLNTWNSRAIHPTFYYPARGTFSPLVRLTYTDGSTETVQRTGSIRVT
ncbi:MAG TPA: carbohydrate-binding protein, partial [Methanoregulaceae archaeon]|nr:carbohydrate-binding protein [Methanoregulaceae archaeon]